MEDYELLSFNLSNGDVLTIENGPYILMEWWMYQEMRLE
jgi:hypothetical protein